MGKNDDDHPIIEQGVPLPTKKKLNRKTQWLESMNIGDSFYLADADNGDDRRIMSARQWGARQIPVRRFVSRQQPGGGMRVWRSQ